MEEIDAAFAQEVAEATEVFLTNLAAISREENAGAVVPILLLEVSQILNTGARLGAWTDVSPDQQWQPDVGPEADADELRLRLATRLGTVDTYSFVFDPYAPELVDSQISDDLTSIASDLEHGLRHFRAGNPAEALWWWQFSYLSSWGNLAGATVNALLTVVAHDRLDREYAGEDDMLAEAEAVLDSPPVED